MRGHRTLQGSARRGYWMIPCVLTGSIAASVFPASAGPAPVAEVTLVLEGGAGSGADLQLDLILRDGRWESEVWGCAERFNYGQHAGRVAKAEGNAAGKARLAVELAVESDPALPGGAAAYAVEIARSGEAVAGSYTGTFNHRPVKGAVRGSVREPAVKPVPGFRPLAPEEHPRLVFRPHDLPELRRRLETPEGRALLEMLTTRSPLRDLRQVDDRRFSWMAANAGVLHRLAGDREAAARARRILVDEVIRKPMPSDRADIHHATRLLGMALTYDLCYDAWDVDFRAHVAVNLLDAMRNLYRGVNEGVAMESVVPAPWAHRNAIRMGAIGLAALALLGDARGVGNDAADDAALARIVRAAERDMVLYLRRGLGAFGAGAEGDFFKAFALSNGVLPFLHALRVAQGRDLSGVNRFLLAGDLLAADAAPREDGAWVFPISSVSVQASGRWPMGFALVPPDLLPAMKWAFDRSCGLQGRKHFDCAYPFQTAYAVATYPFGAAEKHPGEVLPLVAPDPVKARFLYRSAWKDGDDIFVVVNGKGDPQPGLDPEGAGEATEIRVAAFGRQWLGGSVGILPLNDTLGGETLHAEQPRAGQAVLGISLDRAYWQDSQGRRRASRRPARRDGTPEDPFAVLMASRSLPAPDTLRDLGLACTRHVAVDFSGACGAPALIAIVDRIGKVEKQTWQLPLEGARFAGPKFSVGEPGGPNLSGAFAAPAGVRGARIAPGDCVFVVFTLQRGAPPAIQVQGQGPEAKVVVGGQTVSFDGTRIVLAR